MIKSHKSLIKRRHSSDWNEGFTYSVQLGEFGGQLGTLLRTNLTEKSKRFRIRMQKCFCMRPNVNFNCHLEIKLGSNFPECPNSPLTVRRPQREIAVFINLYQPGTHYHTFVQYDNSPQQYFTHLKLLWTFLVLKQTKSSP